MELRQARIKELLDTLSADCIMHDAEVQEKNLTPPKFTDEDVMNATVIFNTICSNVSTHNMLGKVTLEQGKQIAEEMGELLHETVLAMTGVNTKTYFK